MSQRYLRSVRVRPVGRRNARAWSKADPDATQERLGLLFETYLERKRQLRSLGIRPNIARRTMKMFDWRRAQERISTLSQTEFVKMYMVCLFRREKTGRTSKALCPVPEI